MNGDSDQQRASSAPWSPPNGPGGPSAPTRPQAMPNRVATTAMALAAPWTPPPPPPNGPGESSEQVLEGVEYLRSILRILGYTIVEEPVTKAAADHANGTTDRFFEVYDGDEFLGWYWVDKRTNELKGGQSDSTPFRQVTTNEFRPDMYTYEYIQLHKWTRGWNTVRVVPVARRLVKVVNDGQDITESWGFHKVGIWYKPAAREKEETHVSGFRQFPTTIPGKQGQRWNARGF